MLESDDGIIWRYCTTFRSTEGDETAFMFKRNGNAIAIARGFRSGHAFLLEASAPWNTWTSTDLGHYIGGPLLSRWGDRWLVGGREQPGPRTSLYWLNSRKLVKCAELPSGGDTSYPGFIELSPTQAAVSWYSSHEKDASGQTITAIYMADLTIQP